MFFGHEDIFITEKGGETMASEKILDRKREAVTALAEELKSTQTVVLAEYLGLTVTQDTELRRTLREAGVTYHVVKNNIGKRAAEEAGIEGLDEYFVGPTAIAYSEDVVAPAKVLYEFAKKNEIFKVKAGASDGVVLSEADLNKLATMPSMDELRARLVGSLSSPITGFAMLAKAIAEKVEEEGKEVAGDVISADYNSSSTESDSTDEAAEVEETSEEVATEEVVETTETEEAAETEESTETENTEETE